MANEKVYKLKVPVAFGTETITELKLREPCARDLKGLNLNDPAVDGKLVLLGRLSGQPDPVIEALNLRDLKGARAILEGFLADGDEAGNAPS